MYPDLSLQAKAVPGLVDTHSGRARDVDPAGIARPYLECLVRVADWGRMLGLCFRRPRR